MNPQDERPQTHGAAGAGGHGGAQKFIEDLYKDLEDAFTEQFGNRWSPELNQLFEQSQRDALAAARSVDDGLAQPTAQNSTRRVLSNHAGPR